MDGTYIHCKVLPGLFDSEFYVMINGSAAYVNVASVKLANGSPRYDWEVDGAVSVHVIDRKEDNLLVELPGEPVVGGLRNWVKQNQVAV